MKKLFYSLSVFASILISTSSNLFSQNAVPQQINYQAIARNQIGSVFANTAISIRFSVAINQTASPIYQETHQTQTNQFGLFNVKIGAGAATIGNFANINWGAGNQYLKSEIDIQNTGNFVLLGNEQLLSVPFALYAQNAGNAGSGSIGPQGPQGEAGPQGLPGNSGPQGLQGPQGIPGAAGSNGSNGANGSNGTNGINGNTILNGTSNPSGATGNLGDFYLNTASNELFGPKLASGWGSGVSIIGPPGTGGTGSGWSLTGNSGTVSGTNTNQNYVGTSDNKDLILATNQTERVKIAANGNIKLTGNLENQELTGGVISVGSSAITDPTATILSGPGSASAASLFLENNPAFCAVCTQPYAQSLPVFSGQAEVIDYPAQSITVTDGNGVSNSGVLFMANVTIKSTNNATSLGVSNRFSLWVQRSTDSNFQNNVTNVYRVEDGLSGGVNNLVNPHTLGSGIACTNIIYPDLNLAVGTYYYRLVYQNILGSNNGQLIFAQDRSIVLMQIKR